MSVQKSMQANPIQHLRYDPEYRQNYTEEVRELNAKSWETRLVRWAETGGALSKICRWAVVFFSAAPIFAALHDKIQGIGPQQTVDKLLSETAFFLQIYSQHIISKLDNCAKAVIAKYEVPDDVDNDFSAEQGPEADHELDPEDVGLLMPDRAEVSVERAASLYATLHRQDYSDLKPVVQKYIEKSTGLQKAQLQAIGPLQVSTQKDKNGNDYLKCAKNFQIVAEGRELGSVSIERNFNPATEDTVNFNYNLASIDSDDALLGD